MFVCVVGMAVAAGVLIALRFGLAIHEWRHLTVNTLAVFGGVPVVLLVLGTLVTRTTREDPRDRGPVGSPAQDDSGEKKKAHLPGKVPLPPPPLRGPRQWHTDTPYKSAKKKAHPPERVFQPPPPPVTLAKPSPVLAPAPQSAITTETEFTAFSPRKVPQDRWSTLLAYMHVAEAKSLVKRDSWRRFDGDEGEIGSTSAEKTALIPRGAHILVVPQSESMEFNPTQFSFDWLEDFHCAPFRFRPIPKAEISIEGTPLLVRIGFYVSPVLVGEIQFTVSLGESASADASLASTSGTPYQKIFVSYSHDDSDVVDSLEKAYKALGNEYLRDINTLRSGEEWNPAILKRIDESEIFQLLWSEAARGSQYVQQEWEHALSLQRRQFIRPVYWKQPMPPPPPELSSIHFAYVDL